MIDNLKEWLEEQQAGIIQQYQDFEDNKKRAEGANQVISQLLVKIGELELEGNTHENSESGESPSETADG